MAVFKRLTCSKGHVEQVPRESRTPGLCPKCGSGREYSEKWYVSLRIGGEKYVKAVSPKKDDARAHEAELLSQRNSGAVAVKPGKFRFSDAKNEFVAWMDRRVADGKLSESTRERYGYALKNICSWLKETTPISSIDHSTMDRYLEYRKTVTPSNATINSEIAVLKGIMSVCQRKNMIRVNPLSGYESMPVTRRNRFLLVEECSRLIEASQASGGTITYPAVLIGLHTGLRLEGVLSLKWSEIDFKSNRITKVVKGGRTVNIPITQILRSELLRLWQSRESISEYVLVSRFGGRVHHNSDWGFSEAVKSAGLGEDVTFHILRHTFATHFIMATKDIHMLAGILGHSTSTITEIYAHLCDEKKGEAMKTYEEDVWERAR